MDEGGEHNLKRSQFALDIDDSQEDIAAPPIEEDEDSGLPVAPTPSILPDQDDGQSELRGGDPTITFKSIDFARDSISGNTTRPKSRPSFPASDPLGDDEVGEDPTILSEMGRRAISEEPTGRLSRYSFGSIRMSDFGSELEIRRESDQRDQTKTVRLQNEFSGFGVGYDILDVGEETERLEDLQRSPSMLPADESTLNIPALDENFELEIADTVSAANHAQHSRQETVREESLSVNDQPEAEARPQNDINPSQMNSPGLQTLGQEASKPSSQPRRTKLKMTRHGEMVPSLPTSLIKRVAIDAQSRLGNRRPKLGKDHMKALEQATEWYFEQVGEDLEAYSNHARRRKRIDRSDVLMLMRRQRLLQGDGELQKAARELLPKEAVADLDFDAP